MMKNWRKYQRNDCSSWQNTSRKRKKQDRLDIVVDSGVYFSWIGNKSS